MATTLRKALLEKGGPASGRLTLDGVQFLQDPYAEAKKRGIEIVPPNSRMETVRGAVAATTGFAAAYIPFSIMNKTLDVIAAQPNKPIVAMEDNLNAVGHIINQCGKLRHTTSQCKELEEVSKTLETCANQTINHDKCISDGITHALNSVDHRYAMEEADRAGMMAALLPGIIPTTISLAGGYLLLRAKRKTSALLAIGYGLGALRNGFQASFDVNPAGNLGQAAIANSFGPLVGTMIILSSELVLARRESNKAQEARQNFEMYVDLQKDGKITPEMEARAARETGLSPKATKAARILLRELEEDGKIKQRSLERYNCEIMKAESKAISRLLANRHQS